MEAEALDELCAADRALLLRCVRATLRRQAVEQSSQRVLDLRAPREALAALLALVVTAGAVNPTGLRADASASLPRAVRGAALSSPGGSSYRSVCAEECIVEGAEGATRAIQFKRVVCALARTGPGEHTHVSHPQFSANALGSWQPSRGGSMCHRKHQMFWSNQESASGRRLRLGSVLSTVPH